MKRYRVLFLCIGNACRSQMAEGFARHLGSDVADVNSAGLEPYFEVPSKTKEVMREKGIDLSDHFPKGVGEVSIQDFDIVVNLSGIQMPILDRREWHNWPIDDPFGMKDATYRRVRDEIEERVSALLNNLRTRDSAGEV
jgi:arsenate reductase (thioredoxin)